MESTNQPNSTSGKPSTPKSVLDPLVAPEATKPQHSEKARDTLSKRRCNHNLMREPLGCEANAYADRSALKSPALFWQCISCQR